ncbi:Ribosome biogenesis protein BMS1-like protein [Bienertia sinuspersici]
MDVGGGNVQLHKSHHHHHHHQNSKKKKIHTNGDSKSSQGNNNNNRNPKAFAFRSNSKAKQLHSRALEKVQRKLHFPNPNVHLSTADHPPPIVVVVHGPPKVGKSLLIQCLVKHFTKHNLSHVQGPITVVSGLLLF